MIATRLAWARTTPRFSAVAIPPCGRRSTERRGSAAVCAESIGSTASVEPSSTRMNSKSVSVCARMLRMARSRKCPALYIGMTILTQGIDLAVERKGKGSVTAGSAIPTREGRSQSGARAGHASTTAERAPLRSRLRKLRVGLAGYQAAARKPNSSLPRNSAIAPGPDRAVPVRLDRASASGL
jgi:hypothetical protein